MAKGQSSKEIITKKILETFEGSFINEKEIRIPIVENGEPIEIKVALTCAKVNIGGGVGSVNAEVAPAVNTENREITKEEVSEVRDIINKLGL